MKKYVLIVDGSLKYYEPFARFGELTKDHSYFDKPDKVALVVFTGGVDISPSLYGHKPSRLTTCTPKRDVYEMMAYRRARKHELPIVGICRGAQFLCAMSGGTLFQHVTGHTWGTHDICTVDGQKISVSSSHHQMQNPPIDAVILGWAEPKLSERYIGEDDTILTPPEYEYECIYYPAINAVGLQYHPEIMPPKSPGFRYAGNIVEEWLKIKSR